MTKVNRQVSSDEFWTDESGVKIPYNRTTKFERLRERKLYSLYRKTLTANKALQDLKEEVEKTIEELIEAARKENAVKLQSKGSYTFYNFDRTLKVEVKVNELIRFDDLKLESAKEVLLELVRKNVSGDDFFLGIVKDDFQLSGGRLIITKK